jgi:hypothetical protein
MPKIRTVFRPWEEVEVSDEEAAANAAMGLLAPDVVEEVNSSGSSEEGSAEGEAAPGVQDGGVEDLPPGGRQPRRRASNPRVPDAQGQPEGEGVEPGAEEGPTEEEGMTS